MLPVAHQAGCKPQGLVAASSACAPTAPAARLVHPQHQAPILDQSVQWWCKATGADGGHLAPMAPAAAPAGFAEAGASVKRHTPGAQALGIY